MMLFDHVIIIKTNDQLKFWVRHEIIDLLKSKIN
jgi:hypothetical protein